jgi:hypothetical protein
MPLSSAISFKIITCFSFGDKFLNRLKIVIATPNGVAETFNPDPSLSTALTIRETYSPFSSINPSSSDKVLMNSFVF